MTHVLWRNYFCMIPENASHRFVTRLSCQTVLIMKKPFRLFNSRSDVYRALQLFFITSSMLIAVSYAFPGLLHVPWLYPLMVLWAFVLMVISFYYGQTETEEEEEYTVRQSTGYEMEQTPIWEQLHLKSVLPQRRDWDDDDLV